jgi:hypothetical protein
MNGYKEPKFYRADGKLTAYSFACGYVETMGDGWKLFKDGCFHLRRSHAEWLTFGTITEARKAFAEIKRTATYVQCVECRGTGMRLGGHIPSGGMLPMCLACAGNGNQEAITNEGATK